jgi:hypothetical protein
VGSADTTSGTVAALPAGSESKPLTKPAPPPSNIEVPPAPPPAPTPLVKEVNGQLKLLDTELLQLDQEAKSKLALYKDATVTINNHLPPSSGGPGDTSGGAKPAGVAIGGAQFTDAKSWVAAADTLSTMLASDSKLNGSDTLGAALKLGKDIVNPMNKKITDAGSVPEDFLKGKDIYKLKFNDINARDLVAGVQTFTAKAATLRTALSDSYMKFKDDLTVGLANDRLNNALTSTAQKDSTIHTTHEAGRVMGGLANQAAGSPYKRESDNPRWTDVENNVTKYAKDRVNLYTAQSPRGYVDPDALTFAKLHAGDIAELGALESTIASTYKTAATELNSQDFNNVRSDHSNVDMFADSASRFLAEMARDEAGMAKTKDDAIASQEKATALYRDLEKKAQIAGTTIAEVWKADTPEVRSRDVYMKALAESTLDVSDAGKVYTEKIGANAQEYLDGWDQVEKNAKTAKLNEIIQNVFDVFSGGSIVATSTKKLATAFNSIKKGVDESFSYIDYAVNVGQQIDGIQIAVNEGWHGNSLTSISPGTTSGDALRKIDQEMLGVYEKTWGETGSIAKLTTKVRGFTREKAADQLDHLWRKYYSGGGTYAITEAHQKAQGDFNWWVNNGGWLSNKEKENMSKLQYTNYQRPKLLNGHYEQWWF